MKSAYESRIVRFAVANFANSLLIVIYGNYKWCLMLNNTESYMHMSNFVRGSLSSQFPFLSVYIKGSFNIDKAILSGQAWKMIND